MNTLSTKAKHQRVLTKPALVFHLLQAVCLLCGLCQIFLGFNVTNLWCTVLVMLTCTVVLQYLRISNSFIDYPLSSLAILGLLTTSMMTSLVAQTTSLNAIAEYLRSPLLTYGILCVVVLVTVLTHWIYRRLAFFSSIRDWSAAHVAKPMLLLEIPAPSALWTLGLIGVFALAKGRSDTGDVQGKFIQALWGFAWMPFLIPLYYREMKTAYTKSVKFHWIALAVYSGLLLLFGMVYNARTLIIAGPITAAIMYSIFTLQDVIPATRHHIVKIIVFATGFAVAVALFAQLATAMVVVRANRDEVSPKELVTETLVVLFKERHKMQQFKEADYVNYALGNYNEYYIQNPVLARFSDTKFVDNVVSVAYRMDDRGRDEVWQFTKDRMFFMIPQNILDKLHIKFNKDLYYYSGGDIYRNIDVGGMLGSFLLGSIWADLLTLAGPWFPFAVAGVNLVSFLVLDSMSKRGGRITLIAPIAICLGWSIVLESLSGDSLAARIQFILRSVLQPMVLYFIFYSVVRWGWVLLWPSRSDRVLRETPLWKHWIDRSRGLAYRYLPWFKSKRIN